MTGGRAVILGPVGRNFGAGMSGGIAYVYDPHKAFEAYCSPAMIERLPLVEGSSDCQFLQKTLRDFAEKTGSEVAQRILDNFGSEQRHFVN